MELSSAKFKIVIAVACALFLACAAFLFFYRSAAQTVAANLLWKAGLPGPALALDANDTVLAMKLGNFYFGEGAYNPAKAEEAYLKAAYIDPTLPFAHYQLARVLFVEGEKKKALVSLDVELKVNPDNFRSLYMRGLVEAYSDDLPGAEADFKQFIAHAPTEWAGYNDLAWVLGQEGKYAEAEELLKTALSRVPNGSQNAWLLNNLGVQQLNLKQYAEAAASFKSAGKIAAIFTVDMWHRAYPGNDEAASADGIAQFRQAIRTNLEKANAGVVSS